MKHFACLFFLTVLLSTGIFAQISVGVNVSYHQGWQQYADELNVVRANTYINKFAGGATVQYDLGRHLSIVAEPGFVQRGAACFPGWTLPIGGTEGTFVGHYVEMPILLEGRLFAWQDRVQFFGHAGAGYSYMLNGYRQFDFEDPNTPPQRNWLDFSQESGLNRMDFGFYGGAGIGVKAGPGYATGSFRYYHGMPDVEDAQISKNRATSFALGYRLAL